MRPLTRRYVGLSASIAVGVAALYLGSALTADPAPAASPVTEDVAVLAPMSIDGQVVDVDNDPTTLDVSRTSGLATIVPSGVADPDALPPGAAEAIATLDATGADPAESFVALGGEAAGSDDDGAGGGDDPCSPAEGEPPADCPEGIHSAIFADTALEDLEVWPYPGVGTEPVGTSIYCTGLVPADGELALGVGTNLPASISARYWPVADPSDVHSLTLAGVASEEAAWNAEIAASGTYTRNSYVFQHCAMMTDLAPSTDYIVSVLAIDTYTRIAAPVERRFNSAGQPTVPPIMAVPLGTSLLYVGVPTYGEANPPVVRGWVADPGTAPDCSAFDGSHPSLTAIQDERLVEVSRDYLHAHNYADGFDHRVVDVFEVPEGSTLVLCARWYDNAAPSWETDVPTQQRSLVVMSPDAVTPIVTVTSLDVIRPVSEGDVRIEAANQFGHACGEARLPDADISASSAEPLNVELCRVSTTGSGYRAALNSGGNVVLSTYVWTGATSITSRAVLPLSRLGCLGVCALPAPRTYVVPLPTVTVGAGMCGGSGCEPPTRETALGSLEVTVTWEQGNSNGLDHWQIGATDETLPDAPVSDRPQFDLNAGWTPVLSADGTRGTASTSIRTDRHASYIATLSGDCWMGEPPAPVTGTTRPESTGVEVAAITFGGLCPGASYSATVEMVDGAGTRTVASYTRDADTLFWWAAAFAMPINQILVTGTMSVTSSSTWNESWWLVGSDVYLGEGDRFRIWADYGPSLGRCFTGDVDSASGPLSHVTIDQAPVVHLRTYTRVMAESLYYGVDHDTNCDWPGANNYVADVDVDIPFSDLMRGVTIRGDLVRSAFPDEDPQFHYTLTLTATRVTG